MTKHPSFSKSFEGEANIQSAIHAIIRALSSSLPGRLSAIDENCELEFYNFLNKSRVDRAAFSYNWPYVIQATRNHGFYYQKKDQIVYFYLRFNTNSTKHPKLIVVNNLGDDSKLCVCDLASAALKLHITTIIKNIDQDEIPQWKDLGFQETKEPWSAHSFRDDNTFPEFIYDINKLINLDVHSKTRQLIKKILRETNYLFLPYEDTWKNAGLQLLEKNSDYLENKGVDSKKEVISSHLFIFDNTIKNKIVFAIFENKTIIGISFLTQVEENLFFNAIVNENKSNLMRFLLWKSVVHYCEGLEENKKPRYLALQGSENEGQNQWKYLFNPVRLIQRTHLTNV